MLHSHVKDATLNSWISVNEQHHPVKVLATHESPLRFRRPCVSLRRADSLKSSKDTAEDLACLFSEIAKRSSMLVMNLESTPQETHGDMVWLVLNFVVNSPRSHSANNLDFLPLPTFVFAFLVNVCFASGTYPPCALQLSLLGLL